MVWLVQNHLLMSDTAQKRDLAEPRTVRDFAQAVKSPSRLKLLTVLTVCDIRGVGPGVWNNWKAMLLRGLYAETLEYLTGGSQAASRPEREAAAKAALAAALAGWSEAEIEAECARHYAPYWLGFDTRTHAIFAELVRQVSETRARDARSSSTSARDATQACFAMPDHPGIFARLAGALALAGANVVDARTYTTTDGIATAAFWIQDAGGKPYESARLTRLQNAVNRTLRGEIVAREALKDKDRIKKRERDFLVPTRLGFDNTGSDIYTIIEVETRDRPGLLYDLARTLTANNISISSAIIATYGEQAVDVFYVKDLFGLKLHAESKRRTLEARLKAVIAAGRRGAALIRPIRLLPAFLSVGSWTMLSRVLGLARDILMAAFLGTGPVAQAFLIAFTLPNMFRRFFAEGAFNLAFVPMFAKKVEAGEEAEGFARDALSGLGFVLHRLHHRGQIAMPWLVLAHGQRLRRRRALRAVGRATGASRFPILLISLTALLSGVLNSLGRFALSAAAPILMNLVMIAFLLIGWLDAAATSASGDLVGAGGGRRPAGAGLVGLRARRDAGPAAAAAADAGDAPAEPDRGAGAAGRRRGADQPARRPAGRLVLRRRGGLALHADRLYQLPLGVVGVAIGVVLLPDLSRRLKAGDGSGGRDAINRATEFTLALTLPAAVALMVIPVPIVAVLFQRGAFTAAERSPTALAVAVYGAGLPAFVLQKVFSPLFFAREDTRSAVQLRRHAMVVNAGRRSAWRRSSASSPRRSAPPSPAG